MQPMLTIALRAARQAGEYIVRATDRLDRLPVTEKSSSDFVTEVDRKAEEMIIRALQKTYPDHGFLAEESGQINPDADVQWIIDPLDGTTNYIRGIPHYAVSIACMHQGKIEHAVVYNPASREEFTASRGSGAQLNGRRIRVSNRTTLEGSLIGTGTPFQHHFEGQMHDYMQALGQLAGQSAGVRRMGAASLDLAYVAAGRFDAFFEIGLQPWDIAAGLLLVQEAGGLVSDFNGGLNPLDSGNVVCGNPKCFKHTLQVVNHFLGGQGE